MSALLLVLAIWGVAATVTAVFLAATIRGANGQDDWLRPPLQRVPDGVADPESPPCWRCHHPSGSPDPASSCGCCVDGHEIPAVATAPPRR